MLLALSTLSLFYSSSVLFYLFIYLFIYFFRVSRARSSARKLVSRFRATRVTEATTPEKKGPVVGKWIGNSVESTRDTRWNPGLVDRSTNRMR